MKKIFGIISLCSILFICCDDDDTDNETTREDGFTEIEVNDIQEFVQNRWNLESITSLSEKVDLNEDDVFNLNIMLELPTCEIDDLLIIEGDSYTLAGAIDKCSTDEESDASFGSVIYGDTNVELNIENGTTYGFFERFVWNDIIELENPDFPNRKYMQITRFVGVDDFENIGAVRFIYWTVDL